MNPRESSKPLLNTTYCLRECQKWKMAELDACHRCRKSKKGPSQFMTQKVPKHVLYRPLKGYNCFNDFFVGYRFYYGSNLTACLVRCDPLDSRFVLRTIMVVTVWYLAWFQICYETLIIYPLRCQVYHETTPGCQQLLKHNISTGASSKPNNNI